MSVVCFPFKSEHLPDVLNNVRHAIHAHPNVRLVLLVGACKNECYAAVERNLPELQRESSIPIRLILQSRIGTRRPGKGDGMNSALDYFLWAHTYEENKPWLREIPLERIHFFDSDIKSFNADWIIKAEEAAELGYDVVRHFFPRSSTDGMVTWFVTKVGFAWAWPLSELPWVYQPLGGELCFTRRVVEELIADERVRRQSDWAIDTVYTFMCVQKGFSTIEVYEPDGKIHKLYGGLRDLKVMLCECFDAIRDLYLSGEKIADKPQVHRIETPGVVPEAVKQKVGYDIEGSLRMLGENWTPKQYELLELFDKDIAGGLKEAAKWPVFMFMDEDAWIRAYAVLLEHFQKGDPEWEELLFKLWIARVLNYTQRHVVRGYDVALGENMDMVYQLHRRRANEIRYDKNGIMKDGNGFSAHGFPKSSVL